MLLLLAVWPSSRSVAQQVAPNRASAYLFTTDVKDVRAIWVNPAGLGVAREASVYAEASVGDPGSTGKLRQVNAGFNARGLAFGWQHDVLDDGVHGNTYRLGFAGGSGGLGAGLAIARYTGGGGKGTGWDIGVTYVALPSLTVGLLGANIGEPMVRGIEQHFTMVPGLTWRPVSALRFSTDARAVPDSSSTYTLGLSAYAFGLSWTSGTGKWPLGILARLDTDGNLRRGAFTFGLSIGDQDRIGLMTTTPGDISNVDAVSLYGVSSRQPGPGRR